jgi:hypothetical protein
MLKQRKYLSFLKTPTSPKFAASNGYEPLPLQTALSLIKNHI